MTIIVLTKLGMIETEKKFERWCLNLSDLEEMNTLKARDVIMNCFYEAQKETYMRGGRLTGQDFSEAEVRNTIFYSFKSGFKSINADFDNPTVDSINQLLALLMRKAKAMGTPADIIDYHRTQIDHVMTALEI